MRSYKTAAVEESFSKISPGSPVRVSLTALIKWSQESGTKRGRGGWPETKAYFLHVFGGHEDDSSSKKRDLSSLLEALANEVRSLIS